MAGMETTKEGCTLSPSRSSEPKSGYNLEVRKRSAEEVVDFPLSTEGKDSKVPGRKVSSDGPSSNKTSGSSPASGVRSVNGENEEERPRNGEEYNISTISSSGVCSSGRGQSPVRYKQHKKKATKNGKNVCKTGLQEKNANEESPEDDWGKQNSRDWQAEQKSMEGTVPSLKALPDPTHQQHRSPKGRTSIMQNQVANASMIKFASTASGNAPVGKIEKGDNVSSDGNVPKTPPPKIEALWEVPSVRHSISFSPVQGASMLFRSTADIRRGDTLADLLSSPAGRDLSLASSSNNGGPSSSDGTDEELELYNCNQNSES